MNTLQVIVLYSLPTRRARKSSFLITDEDTVVSAQKVAAALKEKGAQVSLVALSQDHIDETIASLFGDLIINLIDWTGADFSLGLIAMDSLAASGIPVAGADRANFAYTDKVAMKKALDYHHIPTPKWQIFHTGQEPVSSTFMYPVFVKLAHEHCSVGIEASSLVENPADLIAVVRERISRFGQDVLVEEFVSGREFQVTVMEIDGKIHVLPPAEIIYKDSGAPEFLSFSERWNEHDPLYLRSHTVLASLSSEQLQIFKLLCIRTFQELGFHDFTRIDMRYDAKGTLVVLEANPNPGLDDDPQYSMTISANAAGMTFADFIWAIVCAAINRTKE